MLIMAGAFSAICYCGSFRGHEVFLVDLHGLIKLNEQVRKKGRSDYVVILLLGRFKGETDERYHITPLAAVTASGIQLKFWVELLRALCRREGRSQGPVFSDSKGKSLKYEVMQRIILNQLQKVQFTHPDVIPETVDIFEEYGISRSFRRSVTTQARNQKVSASDMDAANRWRNTENSQGRKISQPMRDHYAEISQILPTLLRFSAAL